MLQQVGVPKERLHSRAEHSSRGTAEEEELMEDLKVRDFL